MNFAELAPYFADEAKAIEFIEGLIWPDGANCPHCGAADKLYRIKPNTAKRVRHGLWKCGHCKRQFTVKVGTIFEDSNIPMTKWLIAIYMMCNGKKGVSANQLHRALGLSYKASWFMCHRIRLAMTKEPLVSKLGADGGIVEVDETFIGGKARNNRHRGRKRRKKVAVMTLVDREGEARTVVVPDTKKRTLQAIAKPIVDKSATIMTDAHLSYQGLDQYFRAHHAVDHSKHFVRAVILHTNFAESYHSLLKRGLIGTFHHVSEKHLPRYLREFEFRWNSRRISDGERTERAIRATDGKRLTYRPLTRKRRGTLSQLFADKA